MMMSHINASSRPPPKQYPETAAIKGFHTEGAIKNQFHKKKSSKLIPGKPAAAISFMFAPAEKHFEMPVMIMTETLLSFSSSKRYLLMSSTIYDLRALSVLGEFMVIMAIH